MPDVLRVVPRDAESGGKLSQSTIIVIAVVVASVVSLVLALFAWRFLSRWCRRARRVPLPPKQELAHHREQFSSFTDRSRPTTWVDSPVFQQKPRVYSSHFLSVSGSSASLIRSSPDFSKGPTRESSWAVEDATSAENSPFPTPLLPHDLLPPNPSFLPSSKNPHGSMASVVSSSSDGISDVNSPIPPSPSDLGHSVESSASLAHGVRPRPPRPTPSCTRPTSMVSSSGTVQSMQTSHSVSNNIRGPPHSIHSNIQIILPTPLAPELYPRMKPLADLSGVMDRSSSFYGLGIADRRSVASQWVNAGSRSPSMPLMESPKLSYPSPRLPTHRTKSSLSKVASSSSLRNAASAGKSRRTQSQPAVQHTQTPSLQTAARERSPGPVHSRSASASATVNAPKEDAARGRSRDTTPLPASASGAAPKAPPPSAFNMSRSEPSGKLRKGRSNSGSVTASSSEKQLNRP